MATENTLLLLAFIGTICAGLCAAGAIEWAFRKLFTREPRQ